MDGAKHARHPRAHRSGRAARPGAVQEDWRVDSACRAAPGALRAELTWQARPGTAGAIASALAGWNRLRFEVTEDSSTGCDGVRHCYTPDLGLFSAVTGANGDIMVSEDRLRSVMMLASRGAAGGSLEDELGRLLGTAWDNELEPFRRAADGAPVRWLNATG